MAKIKNTGNQPRGFFDEEGGHVIVQPGEEKEFNMTEADFKKMQEVVQSEEPPPYEISGSHGGVKKLNAKEQREAEQKKAEEANKKAMEEQKKHEAEATKEAKAAEKK